MSLRAFESHPTVARLGGVAATVVIAIFLYKKLQAALNFKNGLPLPPGPPARWFWQNTLPTVNIGRTLANWVAECGPVMTLRQGSRITIVIGRVDAAIDIMEKEGNAVVDRPPMVAAGELLSTDLRLLFVRSGERFRRLRKAMDTHLRPTAVAPYQNMQLEHAKNVIIDILNDPTNHWAHAQRYAASVILRWTYGKSTPTSNDDPEVIRIRQTMDNLLHAMRPGSFLVDRIPFLKYIPGFTIVLRQYHEFEIKLFRDLMNRVQSDMDANKGGDSFMRSLLEHASEHQLSKDEMAYLAGGSFNAGAKSTAVVITNMILAAACYPEAQRRVQEELDTIVGRERMPVCEDSKSLPQVHAFVFETLRWRIIMPIGNPHRATQDIIWRGQCIPAGATVIGCQWAISQDPVAFPNPEKFDPQRWIDDQGRLRNDMYNTFAYGFGRRRCPGIHFANQSLYINLALLLWSFRIVQRADAPIDVNDYSDNLISQAAPFDVEFMPRTEESRLRKMICDREVAI